MEAAQDALGNDLMSSTEIETISADRGHQLPPEAVSAPPRQLPSQTEESPISEEAEQLKSVSKKEKKKMSVIRFCG